MTPSKAALSPAPSRGDQGVHHDDPSLPVLGP